MSLRRRLLLALALIAAMVVAVVALTVLAAARLESQLRRTELAYEQRQSVTLLAAQALHYKTTIRDALVDGRGSLAAVELARGHVAVTLDNLAAQTALEFAVVGPHERQEEIAESQRLGALRTGFADLNALVDRMASLREAGHDQAIAPLAETVDEIFARDISDWLAEAIADEEAEVVAADAATARLATVLVAVLIVAGLVAVAVIAAAGIMLDRDITRPLRRLVAAAGALQGGDLGHRVSLAGHDEFAALGARFDAMASALQDRQRELLAARATLEREVDARTRELADANRRLSWLDRQRLLFLADVSHELRTPVTILRGEAEVTLRTAPDLPDVCREALERVLAQAEAMSHLIQDLLFLARSETDSIRFRMQRLDLRPLVADAVEAGRRLALARDVAVVQRLPDAPVWADADPQRLRQAILIAIDNAAKHARTDQPIEVSLTEADGSASISVVDHGAGVPAEDLPHVFERFYRIGGDTGGHQEGSGLGLSIAKWIAEKHAGTIDLASSPGERTILTIRLPVAEDDAR